MKQRRISAGGMMFGETKLEQEIRSFPAFGVFLLHVEDEKPRGFNRRSALSHYVRRHRLEHAEVEQVA